MAASLNLHNPSKAEFEAYEAAGTIADPFVNVKISDAHGNVVNLFVRDLDFLRSLASTTMNAFAALVDLQNLVPVSEVEPTAGMEPMFLT